MKPQIINAKMNRLILKGKVIKAAIFAATVFMVVLMTGSIYLKDRVYITGNGVTKEIFTSETDVYEILKQANCTLGANDRVSYDETSGSACITIHRAFDVTVTADGKTAVIPVTESTAAEVLEKAGITLGEYDELSCPLDEKAYEGMELTVTRIEYRTREDFEEIPFDTEYSDSSNLALGTEALLTAGVPGTKITSVKEKYADGKLTSEEIIGEEITAQPVTEVIKRGTALAEPYSKMDDSEAIKLINGIPESYTRIITGKATAYTAKRGAMTASGRPAEIGTCAVNPNVIPYGSKLYIAAQNGSKVYGYAVAADTGIALMDGRVTVDLYFGNMEDHYDDSCAWGAVQVNIYVLEEGDG